MIWKQTALITCLLCCTLNGSAQEEKTVSYQPQINGTIRAKYEYQPEDRKGRFEVRNARVSFRGNVAKNVAYKAEIDLNDEGRIRMLDAFTNISPFKNIEFILGQMRVPFTIDAHRSPHLRYFANRSFIAKQMGSVRDVGFLTVYHSKFLFPIKWELGLFNGSGPTEQKDYWTGNLNYSIKAHIFLPQGFNVVLSTQQIKPMDIRIQMYDAGAYYHAKGWHAEVEYMYKYYNENSFSASHALNTFVSYDIKLKNSFFTKITPLARYDYMSDNSNGIKYTGGVENKNGSLMINDYKRSRITGGVTLSIDKPFISDIRINYEKYFYGDNAKIKTSEKDKFVVEVMTRF